MNDYNLTDQEQVEQIKQWWHDYGKILAIAIAIGVILGLGGRAWHQHSLNRTVQASSLYQQILVADTKQDMGSVNQLAQRLLQRYASTPYATLTKLILAKDAVQDGDLVSAYPHLQWVLDHSKNASFRQIARLRAARILLAQHQTQPALNLLATVDDDTFQPVINATKGDIYLAMGDADKAKNAYTLAQQQFAANGVGDNIMPLKLAQPLPDLKSTTLPTTNH